jgi:hypothetical protein
MTQKQLDSLGDLFVSRGKFGYCCKDPSCKYVIFKYVRCNMCGHPCRGCAHDRPQQRRRF